MMAAGVTPSMAGTGMILTKHGVESLGVVEDRSPTKIMGQHGEAWGGIAMRWHTIGVACHLEGMGWHCIGAAYHWEDMGWHTIGMTWGGMELGQHGAAWDSMPLGWHGAALHLGSNATHAFQ